MLLSTIFIIPEQPPRIRAFTAAKVVPEKLLPIRAIRYRLRIIISTAVLKERYAGV